jgi:serine/threonine protein kinase
LKTIGEKYQVLEKLGEGFGGSVFLVERNGAKIALKQLRIQNDSACLSPEEILDNFKQEFTTLKKLNHPHILRILDFGFDSKENLYYFTTEYIEGKDIFDATRESTPEEVEELFVQTLRALSYLHSQRVYHLDIKPQNILVTKNKDGKKIAKLIDFGIAGFQKKGVLAGSPGYLAPEALLEESRDGRADLYSLGVTWYTCLYGKNPFEGKNVQETITLQKVWTPPPLSDPSNEIPSYLDPILKKLLKKNPAERYHHADQVIRDLNWGGARHYPLETDATALAYLPGEGKRVGRQAEWGQLLSFFERVFVTRSDLKCGVILSGPPGIGKSRLLKELKYYAQLHTISVLEEKESLLAPANNDSLILIEDADEVCFALAERWMRMFHRHSILIVLTSSSPKTVSGWHNISLKNFDREEVAQYIGSVLGILDPPDFFTEELFSRTEGNPLFLTELLHSLIQSHQLFDEQGRWSPSRLQNIGIDFGKLQVSKSLTEYCQNKLARLSAGAKKILLAASLTKAPLTRHDLSKLNLSQDATDWKILQDENLIAVNPFGNIQLQNPNFRDWVPQTTTPQTLASLHQSLADLFREDPERKEAAWYHLGFGFGTPEERFRALLQYGDSLLNQNRWYDATKAFERAMPIASEPAHEVEVRLRLIRPLSHIGEKAVALKRLEETKEILKKERENPNQWRWVERTFRDMGGLYIKEGRFDLARECIQSSRVLLEEHEENLQEEMILDNLKASLLMREGKLSEAEKISEETCERWQSLSLEKKKEVLNNELANIYLAEGKIEEAKVFLEAQVSFCDEVGERARQAYALYGLALCDASSKKFEEARERYHACASLSRKVKDEELLFHAFNGLGNIAFMQKDWVEASDHYHHALELAQHLEDINNSVGIAINLALVLSQQGDYASANLYLSHVIDTLETLPSLSLHQLQFLIQAYLALGRLYLKELKWIEAHDAYRDAMHLIRSHTNLEKFRFAACIGFAQAEWYLERTREARMLLKDLEKGNLSSTEKEELEEIKKMVRVSKKTGMIEPLKSVG